MKQIETKNPLSIIEQGINTLANPVKITMGGKGKNVLLANGFEMPRMINDGVSIAREIESEDEAVNAVIQLGRQAAEDTNAEAGDGTTTTIVLLQAYVKAMMELKGHSDEKIDVRSLRDEIHKILKEDVVKRINDTKRDMKEEDMFRIANNSALDENIAKAVSETMARLGKDGLVMVEESNVSGITYDIVNGLRIDDGYSSPRFINDPRTLRATLEEAFVLCSRKRIQNMLDLVDPSQIEKRLLNQMRAVGKNTLAIFVEDMNDDLLNVIVQNSVVNGGTMNIVVVRTRNLDDIAIVTGAKVIEEGGKDEISMESLGTAGRIEVGKFNTIIMDGKAPQEDIEKEVEKLREQRTHVESDIERARISQRIAKLIDGVSVIKIGGDNVGQTKEMKLKLEDSLNAVKSAIDDGIVEGGGMALYRIAQELRETVGHVDTALKGKAYNLIIDVLETPLSQILENADEDVERVKKLIAENPGKGYNVVTRKMEDLFETGVIDPSKVLKSALKNAFATGTSFLTVGASVVTVDQK
jgi:chaperonin GroEL